MRATLRFADVDPLRVLGAAYDLEAREADWLLGVLDTLVPVIAGEQGATAWEYRFDGPTLGLSTFVDRGAPRGWEIGAQAAAASGVPEVLAIYRAGPCTTLIEQLGRAVWNQPVYKERIRPLGLVDFVGCNAADAEGRGVVFGAAHGRVLLVEQRARTLLSHLLAHVAAVHRVRRRLESGELDCDEAICELSGAVVHAEEPAKSHQARTALRAAAVAIDRARRRSRKSDPGDPIASWRALVNGRWTLVDRFERDGRQYLVAKRNDPRVTDPSRLSEHERQVVGCAALGHSNKLIAYELGITEAAVATRLSRAAKKLGVRSRVELIRVVRAALLAEPTT